MVVLMHDWSFWDIPFCMHVFILYGSEFTVSGQRYNIPRFMARQVKLDYEYFYLRLSAKLRYPPFYTSPTGS